MNGTLFPLGPRLERNARRAISAFRGRYADYVVQVIPRVLAGADPPMDKERQELHRLAAQADQAVKLAGVNIAMSAPPAYQPAPVYRGVAALAFLHEDHLFQRSFERNFAPTSYRMVLDSLDQADALLEGRQKEKERLAARLDRSVRRILGLPAYLIGVIAGLDLRTVNPSQARTLWWLSLAADFASVYGLGIYFGWW